MKKNLLDLIMQTDEVKKEFYSVRGNGVIAQNHIYKSEKFLLWKQEVLFELQEIYDRKRDKFIWSVLVILKQGFNGWNDEESYNKLSGSLITIKKNIYKYFPNEKNIDDKPEGENGMNTKKPKIFISHSSKDKEIVTKIVKLFKGLGLRKENLFCSSVTGYDIPLGEDIYEYLKTQFHKFDLHVIFVLSQNYYDSTPCLNEMGAAWVLKSKSTIILAPKYKFEMIKGAINKQQIGLRLDEDTNDIKVKLDQIKENITEEFELEKIGDKEWEQERDKFIEEVNSDKEYIRITDNCRVNGFFNLKKNSKMEGILKLGGNVKIKRRNSSYDGRVNKGQKNRIDNLSSMYEENDDLRGLHEIHIEDNKDIVIN